MAQYEVVIIGGGPAGLAAGLYASRSGLKSLLVERGIFGGQMVNAVLVENYPGFPEGVSGFDLGLLMHQQAIRYGLEAVNAEVTGLVPGQRHRVLTGENDFEAETVIIATGSEYRKLNVPGEEKMVGRGVSYCATCDGVLFRDREVAVIGGGDTAVADALELSQHCSRVYLVHRRDELRAGEVLRQRAFAEPRIAFIWDSVVEEVAGEEKVRALKLRNVKTNQPSSLEVEGVFVAVGLTPNSQGFAGLVKLSDTGHVIADRLTATSIAGIFAAGDVRQDSARQIVTAAGDGAAAAIAAFKYLRG